MNSIAFDKETVEKEIKQGDCTVTFQNASDIWFENNRVQKLSKIFSEIMDRLIAEKILITATPPKLIVVTSNIKDEATYWAKQLGRPEGVTETDFGDVSGKVFVWGDDIKDTHSVIILKELVMSALVFDIGELSDASEEELTEIRLVAKRLFAHELAHVDADLIKRVLHKSIPPEAAYLLQNQLADILWSEFYCESVAYRAFGISHLHDEGSIEMLTGLLEHSLRAINQEILNYRYHGNTEEMFSFATNLISALVAQTGRSLGIAHTTSENSLNIETLMKSIGKASKQWEEVTQLAYDHIRNELLNAESYDQLGNLVMKYFHIFGIYPRETENEPLYIDVPLTPETTPKDDE